MTQALRRSSLLECNRCGLRETRRRVVPGDGPVPCNTCLVGEAPGMVEETLGLPFVGRAGEVLDDALRSAGVKREELYITNVVKCRPPNNRIPTEGEIRVCTTNWLWDELRRVQPRRIIALGRTATNFFLHTGDVALGTGDHFNIYVPQLVKVLSIFPMFHPAAILHNPTLSDKFFSVFSEVLR